jgi:16S rRNA (cytosine967-C5)-methyltransferase
MNRRPRSPAPRPRPAHTPVAELTAAVSPAVLHAVMKGHERLAPALASALAERDRARVKDRYLIVRSLEALMRWWGWIEPLHLKRIEEQLLLAGLLDSAEVSAMARAWAARTGRHPDRLVPVGDAPNWTGRAEGLKRFTEGRPVNADPWRLFPDWMRDQLPVPPGEATPKLRKLEFLAALQSRPPLWVGVRGRDEKSVWAELRDSEIKPWIHRRVPTAAKLPADTDLSAFESFRQGQLVPHDIASQAVGLVCDPDPGERWWDVNADNGLQSLHLATLMRGKGLVVSTFENERRRQAIARKLRGSPFRNITTRLWDGRHVAGKAGSFHGVLVDAISSGIGGWRRKPDARWTIVAGQIPELASRQLQWLDVASSGVRPGGTLVYTVATVTRRETIEVVSNFLEAHADFKLEPFPHPLEDATTGGTLQLWPQIHDGEARFVARMTRAAAAYPKKPTNSAPAFPPL